MKKEFETPKFELVIFLEDIITTSGGNTDEWKGNENVPGNGSQGWV